MLSIANVHLDSPAVLAPLAGYSDLPFRILCRRYGAGLTVSEMISCHGIWYRQDKTMNMMQTDSEDQPVSFQLFGADPELMGEAAGVASRRECDLIDINMGCPVKKVTKRGAGAALMADIRNAEKIVDEVVKHSQVPVTVKIRAGVDQANINAVEFAKMIENSGAAAVTVHGRTWAQGFSGFSDRDIIGAVKENLNIPVIGNGDITCYADGLQMQQQTGCDGFMIGRGSMGNPWAFSPDGRPENGEEILKTALEHAELMKRFLPVDRMLGCLKNQLGKYFKGLPGSSSMRKAVYEQQSFDDLLQLFRSHYAS